MNPFKCLFRSALWCPGSLRRSPASWSGACPAEERPSCSRDSAPVPSSAGRCCSRCSAAPAHTPRRWARNRPVIATSQEVVTAEACACGGRQDCTQAAEDRFRAWNAGKHRCDEALAQPFRPTYRLLTGLVANVSDPLAYQGLLLELNSQMGIIIQDQLAMAELGAMLWVHVEVARPYGLAGELPPLQVEQLPDPR